MFNNTLLNSNATSNGSSTTKTPHDHVFTDAQITTFQLCYGFVGSVGLLENIGVIVVILSNKILLDFSSNWFVLNLAIADAFTCLLSALLVFTIEVYGISPLFGYFVTFAFISSAGNLFILTFNRFLSVYDSLRYSAMMPITRARRLVFIPWIVAFLLCAFNAYCNHASIKMLHYIVKIYYSVLILSTTALNIYMLKKAREKRIETKRLAEAILGINRKSYVKKKHRRFIRLVVVFLTFFGSCIPIIVVSYVYPSEESRRSGQFQRTFMWCAFAMLINAIIDPYVYSINHPIFNRYLRKVRVCFPENVGKQKLNKSSNTVKNMKIHELQTTPAIMSSIAQTYL